jgi:hypothetical protein
MAASSGGPSLEDLERRFGLGDDNADGERQAAPTVPMPVGGPVGGFVAAAAVPYVDDDRGRERGERTRRMSFLELFTSARVAFVPFIAIAGPIFLILALVFVLAVQNLASGPFECEMTGGVESCQAGGIETLLWLYTLLPIVVWFLLFYAVAVVSQAVRHGTVSISLAAMSALGSGLKYIGVLLVLVPAWLVAVLLVALSSGTGIVLIPLVVGVLCLGSVAAGALLLIAAVFVDLARSA